VIPDRVRIGMQYAGGFPRDRAKASGDGQRQLYRRGVSKTWSFRMKREKTAGIISQRKGLRPKDGGGRFSNVKTRDTCVGLLDDVMCRHSQVRQSGKTGGRRWRENAFAV